MRPEKDNKIPENDYLKKESSKEILKVKGIPQNNKLTVRQY